MLDGAEAKRVAEERGQLIRHRGVDLQQMKRKLESPRAPEPDGSMVFALCIQTVAKDSELTLSHYVMGSSRKSMKPMERMQKLMMVMEVTRKGNLAFGKDLLQRTSSGTCRMAANLTQSQPDVKDGDMSTRAQNSWNGCKHSISEALVRAENSAHALAHQVARSYDVGVSEDWTTEGIAGPEA